MRLFIVNWIENNWMMVTLEKTNESDYLDKIRITRWASTKLILLDAP